MTSKVGPKGQVVIPQQLRRQLGIGPGDEVEFWGEGDQIIVRAARSRARLRGRFAGEPLTADLVRQRDRDREVEDRR